MMFYTLAPKRLVGWNRKPSPAALRFFPEAMRPRVIIRQLPEARDASRDRLPRFLRGSDAKTSPAGSTV